MKPVTIISRPSAMFHDNDRYIKRAEALIAKVMGAVKAQGDISEDLLSELYFFPESYKALVLYPPVQEQLIEGLANMPQVAYDIVVSDYESNAPYLETSLYNCPDLVYKLLVWAKETGTDLRYNQSFYDALLLEDLIWAIRWNEVAKNEQFPYVLMDYVEENRFSDGGSACLFLKMNPKENALPYSSAIAYNWRYALLGALLFKDRGIDLGTVQSDAILQPQWAYHFAKYIPDSDAKTCEQTLIRHPLWLAQYLTDIRPEKKQKLGALALDQHEAAQGKSGSGSEMPGDKVPQAIWMDFADWLKVG